MRRFLCCSGGCCGVSRGVEAGGSVSLGGDVAERIGNTFSRQSDVLSMSDDVKVEDLAAIGRDDALLDALGQGICLSDCEELTSLLVKWRQDMLFEPIPELVTVGEAQSVLAKARKREWWFTALRVFECSLYVLLILVALTIAVGI
jgi:hypothetical protein